MHCWDTVTPIEEVVSTLNDFVREGKNRHFGFSDVPAWYVGVDTLIVIRRDQLLDREDAETRSVFMKGFTERVPVTFNSTIASAGYCGSRFHVGIAHADGTHSNRDSEALLFCIGRLPNSDNIGIQNTDLKPNARGYVESDDHLRTPVRWNVANQLQGFGRGEPRFTRPGANRATSIALTRSLVEKANHSQGLASGQKRSE